MDNTTVNHLNVIKYKVEGNYYIHRHFSDIGRLAGLETSQLANTFSVYRQEVVSKAILRQLKDLYSLSIRRDMETSNIIDSLFNNDMAFTDFMNDLDKTIQNKFKDIDNSAMVDAALKVVKDNPVPTWKNGKKELLATDMNKVGQQLNAILLNLQNLLQLINANKKPIALNFLVMNTNNKHNLQDYGDNLKTIISQLEKELAKKSFKINNAEIQHIMKPIKSLMNALGTTEEPGNKHLTYGAIKNIFDLEIFSKGIGEIIGLKTYSMATEESAKAILKSTTFKNSNAGLEGENPVKASFYDADGKFVSSIGEPRAGKTDKKLSNVEIHLKDMPSAIYIDLGFSIKTYQTNAFRAGFTQGTAEFKVGGSGLGLDQLIGQTFNSEKLKHLAYNLFAWHNISDTNIATAVINMQDCLFSRDVISAFSSRGRGDGSIDFSQYFLFNGVLISLWEVIKYIFQNNIGQTRSMLNKQNQKNGVFFSLGSKDQYASLQRFQEYIIDKEQEGKIKMSSVWGPLKRTRVVNDILGQMKPTGYIRPGIILKEMRN